VFGVEVSWFISARLYRYSGTNKRTQLKVGPTSTNFRVVRFSSLVDYWAIRRNCLVPFENWIMISRSRAIYETWKSEFLKASWVILIISQFGEPFLQIQTQMYQTNIGHH
jgi:hypothetical protein